MEFLEGLQKYWSIILFTGSVIFSWAYFQFKLMDLGVEIESLKVKNQEEMVKLSVRIDKNEIKMEKSHIELQAILSSLNNSIIEISTSLRFIQQEIKEIKGYNNRERDKGR